MSWNVDVLLKLKSGTRAFYHYISTIKICNGDFGGVLYVQLEELSCLLVGETSRLGVVLREHDGSDSPNS